jgi:hypothetical protein
MNILEIILDNFWGMWFGGVIFSLVLLYFKVKKSQDVLDEEMSKYKYIYQSWWFGLAFFIMIILGFFD